MEGRGDIVEEKERTARRTGERDADERKGRKKRAREHRDRRISRKKHCFKQFRFG